MSDIKMDKQLSINIDENNKLLKKKVDDELNTNNSKPISFPKFSALAIKRGFLNHFDHKRKEVRVLSNQDFICALLVAAAYFCAIFSRVFVSSVAPAMQVSDERLTYTTSQHANLLIGKYIIYFFL